MLAHIRFVVRLLVVVSVCGLASAARAVEPADRGVSFTAWGGAGVERTATRVDNGKSLHNSAPIVVRGPRAGRGGA